MAEQAATAQITRAADDIRRALELLKTRNAFLTAHIGCEAGSFVSTLTHIDADGSIEVQPSQSPKIDEMLLSRPRCSFEARIGASYLEFVAASPRRATRNGQPVIRLDFPDVLVYVKRRAEPRIALPDRSITARILVDAEGVLPFDGHVAEISKGGLALLYSAEITLEPGTLLKGCRIDLQDRSALSFDAEVRYSMLVTLSDGVTMHRTGCRFVGEPPDVDRILRTARTEG